MGKWGANQWALLTKEATWGVFDAEATDTLWLELPDDGQNLMEHAPVVQTTRAATRNLRRRKVSRKYNDTGRIRTMLFSDQAALLIPWFATPVVDADDRLNLPSYTLDWFDGVEARRFTGLRVEQGQITSNNQNDFVNLDLTVRAKGVEALASFDEPTIGDYPDGPIYCHQDSAGQIKIGSVVTKYRSLTITYRNMLDPQFDEFDHLSSCDYCGRDVNWEIVLQNLDTTLKAAFEAQTAMLGQVKWSIASPAHSVTFNLQNANYIAGRDIDRAFNRTQYQTIRLESHQDMTSGEDAIATAA